jgi:predicted ATP-dependent serine protease
MKMNNLLLSLSTIYFFLIEGTCFSSLKVSKQNPHVIHAFPQKTVSSKGPVETFLCENCGAEHIKWVGRCTSCKEWNTVKEFKVRPLKNDAKNLPPLDSRGESKRWLSQQSENNPNFILMSSVNITSTSNRLKCWSMELNRVFGGGLVRGSVILLTGEPGLK